MEREHDLGKFNQLIQAMAATFRAEADEALLTGYWLGLQDLSIADVTAGVTRAIRTSKFMPAAAELREMAGEMPIAERTARAFEILDRCIESHGVYHSVHFDDPVLNATIVNLGGMMEICRTDKDEWNTHFRRRFEKVYSTLAQSRHPIRDTSHLGLNDQHNVTNGYGKPNILEVRTGLPAIAGLRVVQQQIEGGGSSEFLRLKKAE